MTHDEFYNNAVAAYHADHAAGHIDADTLADRIATLDQRMRLAGYEPAPADPRTPEQRAFDRVTALPEYPAEQFAKAGIEDAALVDFATRCHMAPGIAALLANAVNSDRPARPDQQLGAYTARARDRAEAREFRTAHEREAADALRNLGGAFAAQLATKLDRLPASSLDTLILTVRRNADIASRRPV